MVQDSLTRRCDVFKYVTLLLPEGRHDRQYTLGKLTAGATLGPKAPLAPEHYGTQGPLSGIIGQFYLLVVDKSPQGWLMVQ